MNVTCRFGLSSIVIERQHTLTLMVRVEAPPTPKRSERKPFNLGLVLDHSGSMAGDKLDFAKAAAAHLVQHLKPTDRVTLVAYDSDVHTLVESRPVGDKRELLAKIGWLQAGSMTNLSGGWLAGLAQVQAGMNPETVNRVLLLTDGLANCGVVDHQQLRQIGTEYRSRGISTTTLGFGDDFDEILLRDVAHDAGGAFYFIGSPEDAPGTFTEELGELQSVVGQNLTVELRGQPPARVLAILNEYPTEQVDNGFRIQVGDLFGDEQREILAEILVPGMRELGPHQVGSIVVEFDQIVDPITHQWVELPVEINAVTSEQAQATPDPEVESPANLLRVNELRRAMIQLATEGKFDEARKQIEQAKQEFESRGGLDVDVEREFERIQQELTLAIEQREHGLKRMHYQHYAASTGRGEYRLHGTSAGREAALTGMRGMVQVQPATRDIESQFISLENTLMSTLEQCDIRVIHDIGYWSIVRKLLGSEPDSTDLSADDEQRLYQELRRTPRGDVRIVFGPWIFADRHFSHWYRDSRLALVAMGDFETLTSLPLAALLIYETLLHGLRVYPDYDPAELMHEETRACLFDLCPDKHDIRRKLLEGVICDECRPKLEQLGIVPASVQECLARIGSIARGNASRS